MAAVLKEKKWLQFHDKGHSGGRTERRNRRERNRKAVIAHMRKQKNQLMGELAQAVIILRATGFFIQA